jgi:hypothetical protein
MTGIITYLPILALNVNGLNSPIKRHRLANKLQPTGDSSHQQKQALAERESWKKIYKANGP